MVELEVCEVDGRIGNHSHNQISGTTRPLSGLQIKTGARILARRYRRRYLSLYLSPYLRVTFGSTGEL